MPLFTIESQFSGHSSMALSSFLLCCTMACTAGLGAPPRGWNSWNSFQQWINETQLLAQADFIVNSGMKELGWEYIISDGGWYYPSDFGHDSNKTLIDKWGRFLPTPDRYPSGWKAICDKIHARGLKCGFHLFRGVPGRAWEQSSPIKKSPQNYTVRDAGFNGRPGQAVVDGHGAFYEINMKHPAAKQYLDSMFELYCSWGIDFIKLDGTSSGRKNETSYEAIEAYRASINRHCGGRDVVLSLSAGGPGIPGWPDEDHGDVDDEYVDRLRHAVQMIRVTPDTWDIWDDDDTACPLKSEWSKLKAVTTTGPYANVTGHSGCCWGGRIVKHFEEFDRYAHIADQYGVFPDGDMLQLGRVGSYPNLTAQALQLYGVTDATYEPVNCTVSQLQGVSVQAGAAGGGYDPQNCPRMSYLDFEEQRTLLTLWAIARSPLIMGGDLTQSPAEIVNLLKNRDILAMNSHAIEASQVFFDKEAKSVAWKSTAVGTGLSSNGTYVAVFNLASGPQDVSVSFQQLFGDHAVNSCKVRELWSGNIYGRVTQMLTAHNLARHATAAFFINECKNDHLKQEKEVLV